jgi:hypothetical protein
MFYRELAANTGALKVREVTFIEYLLRSSGARTVASAQSL